MSYGRAPSSCVNTFVCRISSKIFAPIITSWCICLAASSISMQECNIYLTVTITTKQVAASIIVAWHGYALRARWPDDKPVKWRLAACPVWSAKCVHFAHAKTDLKLNLMCGVPKRMEMWRRGARVARQYTHRFFSISSFVYAHNRCCCSLARTSSRQNILYAVRVYVFCLQGGSW